jgi:enamine deaminase RidA (YjgF/YER057c/UK114 family)
MDRAGDPGASKKEISVLIAKRLADLGLELPEPMRVPAAVTLPFPWVRVAGTRALISGHGPLLADGSLPPILGKVGSDVPLEQAYEAARSTALSMLSSLQRELGDLDRIKAWVRVFGMVNAAPGFTQAPTVINGFSDLILELWGEEAGRHARSAIGVAELPFRIPVEIEAEILIDKSLFAGRGRGSSRRAAATPASP